MGDHTFEKKQDEARDTVSDLSNASIKNKITSKSEDQAETSAKSYPKEENKSNNTQPDNQDDLLFQYTHKKFNKAKAQISNYQSVQSGQECIRKSVIVLGS